MSDGIQITDAVLAATGHKAAQVGGATTIFGWLLSSEGAALIGIAGMLVGLLMQWYFNRRRDKREQEAHDALMRRRG